MKKRVIELYFIALWIGTVAVGYAEAYIIKVPEGFGCLTTYYIKDEKIEEIFQEVKERLFYTFEADSFDFLEYEDSIIMFSTLFGRKIAYGKMSNAEWTHLLDFTGFPNGVSHARAYQLGTYLLFHVNRSGASERYGSEYVVKINNREKSIIDLMVVYDRRNKLPKVFDNTYPYKQPGGDFSFFFPKISFFDYTFPYSESAIDGYKKNDPKGYGIYSISKEMKVAYYSIKEEITVPTERMVGIDVVPCLLDKVNPGFTLLKSYYDYNNMFKVKYRTFQFDYKQGTARFVEEGYIEGDYHYAIYELPRENREYPTILKLPPEEIAKIKPIVYEEDGTQERIHRERGMLYVRNVWEVKNTDLFEQIIANPPVKELTLELSDF